MRYVIYGHLTSIALNFNFSHEVVFSLDLKCLMDQFKIYLFSVLLVVWVKPLLAIAPGQ